jgi:hypothetical protein
MSRVRLAVGHRLAARSGLPGPRNGWNGRDEGARHGRRTHERPVWVTHVHRTLYQPHADDQSDVHV